MKRKKIEEASMQNAEIFNFKNQKELNEALDQGRAAELFEKVTDLKSALSLRNAVRTLDKKISQELLKSKDNPEKWFDLYKTRLLLDQEITNYEGSPSEIPLDRQLFEQILFLTVKTVLHEHLDLETEPEDEELTQLLDQQKTPEEIFDEEIESDESFQELLELQTQKDIKRTHERLSTVLKKYNNSYTLKQADYKLETVKVPTIGFLGRSLFPGLRGATLSKKSKQPCPKGLGDWISIPTSFVLARTNDILQEAKGRLSLYAEKQGRHEESRRRLTSFFGKIKSFFNR